MTTMVNMEAAHGALKMNYEKRIAELEGSLQKLRKKHKQLEYRRALDVAGFNSDVKPLAYGAYALYGIGGAAAATGLAFLIMDWTKPAAASAVHIAPVTAPGMYGLTIDLDF